MPEQSHIKILKIEEHDIEIMYLEFANGIALYIYINSPKMGTTSLSVPGSDTIPPSTVFLVGSKFDYFLRMIGEKIAKITGKMVLISLNITEKKMLNSIWKKIKDEII